MNAAPAGLAGRSISPSADKTKDASILVIALWSLCLLSAFALILGDTVRQKIALVKRLDERGRLRLIAEAGVIKAIAELKNEEQKSYDSLNDGWSDNPAAFKDTSVGGGTFSIAYDFLNERANVVEVRYGLIDEERKININYASMSILERLFKAALGMDEIQAQELAASIIDWRDNDSELSIPLGSAEDSYYRGLRYSYEAKDAPFEVLDELLLVKGMTPETFEKVKDYLTVHSSGKVNINTASKVVLLALGFSEDIADKILFFRYGDSEPDEGGIFDTPSNIVPRLSELAPLSPSELTIVSAIAEQNLCTASDNFMIHCIARLPNRKNDLGITCIVDRSGKILYWNETLKNRDTSHFLTHRAGE